MVYETPPSQDKSQVQDIYTMKLENSDRVPSKYNVNFCLHQTECINNLGDNCILKFSFGEVYRRIYGQKFSFTVTLKRSRKT